MPKKNIDIDIDDFMAVSSGSLREPEEKETQPQINKPISRRRTNSVQVLLNDKEFAKFAQVRDMMGVKNSEAGRQLLMQMVDQLLAKN
jgi:hypothetical protein